jgi:hypothetical protein
LSNVQEYQADTDPNDPASYLRIEDIETDFALTGTVKLTFPAVAHRTYSILFKDVLGPSPWAKLVDVSAAPTNRLTEIIDQPPVARTQRFYRLVTPRMETP